MRLNITMWDYLHWCGQIHLKCGWDIPWPGVPNWVKRRVWGKHQRSALLVLTTNAMWPAVSCCCHQLFTTMVDWTTKCGSEQSCPEGFLSGICHSDSMSDQDKHLTISKCEIIFPTRKKQKQAENGRVFILQMLHCGGGVYAEVYRESSCILPPNSASTRKHSKIKVSPRTRN